jgi:hypothetical protein
MCRGLVPSPLEKQQIRCSSPPTVLAVGVADKRLARQRGQMRESGLIYDFDGVIADSEALANTVLAETITSLGRPTTLDEALDRYMGKRWPEVIALIESDLGRALPNSFSEDLKMATLERFSADLREVQGASSFIRHFHDIPRCIAHPVHLIGYTPALKSSASPTSSARMYTAATWWKGASHIPIYLSLLLKN